MSSSQGAGSGNSPNPESFSDQGGYYIFPNGLIMQWGKSRGYADRLYKVYFPLEFPHKVMNVVLTSQNNDLTISSMDNSSPLVGKDLTTSYFVANTDGLPYVNRQDDFFWFAIGY